MEKKDLRIIAESLAEYETKARMYYERMQQLKRMLMDNRFNRRGRREIEAEIGILSDKLQKIAPVIQTTRRNADSCRSQVEKCRDKQYWWDIPFDLDDMPSKASMSSSFSAPYYFISEDMEIQNQWITTKTHRKQKSSLSSDIFLGKYIFLYVDKDVMMDPEDDEFTVMTIYQAESSTMGYQFERNSTRLISDYEVAYARAEADRAIRAVNDDFNATLNSFDKTVKNIFGYTQDEMLVMGAISSDDWWMMESFKGMKAYAERDRNMQYASEASGHANYLEHMRNRQIAMQGLNELTKIQTTRTLPVGEVFYIGNQIAAIVEYKNEYSIIEISHEMDKLFSGSLYGTKFLHYEHAFDFGLYRWVAEHFGNQMKKYNVLSSRPKGMNDRQWRIWAECRWLYR